MSDQNINDQKMSEQEMAGQKISEQKISEQKMAGQEISEQEMAGQEISEQEMAGQEISEQEMAGQKISNQEMAEQKISEQEMAGQKINEQKINEQEMAGQEISEQEMAGQKISEQKMADRKISDQKISGRKMNGEKLSDQNLNDQKRDAQKKQMHDKIIQMVREYCDKFHTKTGRFEQGERIPYSGRVYDSSEMANLTDAVLEFWLTQGRYTQEFEAGLAAYIGTGYCSLVNSGSSANLAAFMALTAEELGERRIRRGDEVITAAAGFPTTVSPIVQYGAVPVFVDVSIPEYNICTDMLEKAVSDRTKAVILAHTLGNPFDLQAVKSFCDAHGLWLVEDNCDALGSEYFYGDSWRRTGSVGDISTCSFYPPHHMTMGEGGAVCTDNPLLHRLVRSFRDWGRDCWCQSGADGTCGHRFTQQFGELPPGYDHKYVYSHFGYNLKATDLQAAVGCAQLGKLPGFVAARRKNWQYLREGLDGLGDKLILPAYDGRARPSWFGFLMTVREGAGFSRNELAQYLEGKNIQTRCLFAGNLLKHPCFDGMRKQGQGFRVAGSLNNTDRVMDQSLWIGVYPGMTDERLDYMIKEIQRFAGHDL